MAVASATANPFAMTPELAAQMAKLVVGLGLGEGGTKSGAATIGADQHYAVAVVARLNRPEAVSLDHLGHSLSARRGLGRGPTIKFCVFGQIRHRMIACI